MGRLLKLIFKQKVNSLIMFGFRHPLSCKLNTCSSGTLFIVDRQSGTDVSGRTFRPHLQRSRLNLEDGLYKQSVPNYQRAISKTAEGRISHFCDEIGGSFHGSECDVISGNWEGSNHVVIGGNLSCKCLQQLIEGVKYVNKYCGAVDRKWNLDCPQKSVAT